MTNLQKKMSHLLIQASLVSLVVGLLVGGLMGWFIANIIDL